MIAEEVVVNSKVKRHSRTGHTSLLTKALGTSKTMSFFAKSPDTDLDDKTSSDAEP